MLKLLIQFSKICQQATIRFFHEEYGYRVSALAFASLLAIVPTISISVFFATKFPLFTHLITEAENYLLKNFIPTSAYKLELYFQQFIHQAAHMPFFSVILLLLSAILMIETIDETLNDIWHVQQRRKKIIALCFYSLIVVIAPLFLGGSVLLTSYLFTFSWLSNLTTFLLFSVPIIINTLIFSTIYIIAPNVPVKWYHGLIGGFIVALLLDAARFAFTFYISKFSSYELIYGAFAIIPIFLVWLYINWFIFLWGALITQIITKTSQKKY